MGLDMYVYQIEKLKEEEISPLVGIPMGNISNEYHYIDKETVDEDPEMYSDLIPFVSEIPVIAMAFNHKACFADNNIEEGDSVCGSFYNNSRVGWSFASGAKIDISREEYEKYLFEVETLVYVFKSKEVAYWRKFYDLDEFLEAARIISRTKRYVEEHGCPPGENEVKYWKTENCGYYMLSPEEKQSLDAYLSNFEEDDYLGHYHSTWSKLIKDPESVLMYHAWW